MAAEKRRRWEKGKLKKKTQAGREANNGWKRKKEEGKEAEEKRNQSEKPEAEEENAIGEGIQK